MQDHSFDLMFKLSNSELKQNSENDTFKFKNHLSFKLLEQDRVSEFELKHKEIEMKQCSEEQILSFMEAGQGAQVRHKQDIYYCPS